MGRLSNESLALAAGVAGLLGLVAYEGAPWLIASWGALVVVYCLYQLGRQQRSRNAPALKPIPPSSRPHNPKPTAPNMPSDSFFRTRLDSGAQGRAEQTGHRIPTPATAPAVAPVPPSSSARAGSAPQPQPPRPTGPLPARWVPPAEVVEVCGYRLLGGLFYLGSVLKDAYKDTDPSLVDPRKPVLARPPAVRARLTDYWPSYSRLSPEARASYLHWLAGGRQDPDADPAFVTLFFYGLERHVLLDGVKVKGSREHWPAIEAELARLHSLYGKASSTLSGQLLELLQYMQLIDAPKDLYLRPLPPLHRIANGELPHYLRLAVGQACRDRVAVPPALAFAWQKFHPLIAHRTAVRRCPHEFAELFPSQYAQMYGAGFRPANARNHLVLSYRPVSSAFDRADSYDLDFGVPDVALRTEYVHKLQFVVDQCNELLRSFSRSRVKEQGKAMTVESLLRLPANLWPDSAQEVFESLQDRTRSGFVTTHLAELTGWLAVALGAPPLSADPGKDAWQGLMQALKAYRMLPALAQPAKTPGLVTAMVLYAWTDEPVAIEPQVQLQLDAWAFVRFAAARERPDAVHAVLDDWLSLTDADVGTLMALAASGRVLLQEPPTAAALRKRVAPLSLTERHDLVKRVCVALSWEGQPGPEDIRTLEGLYKTLGLDLAQVYSDLHEASTAPRTVRPSSAAKGTAAEGVLSLDLSRVGELQRDSEQVAGLLADIFALEEGDAEPRAPMAAPALMPSPMPALPESAVSAPAPLEEGSSDASPSKALLGDLSPALAALADALLSQRQLSRDAWEALCAAQGQMPDGALESLNEASFDLQGVPFTEGDDPIELTPEILELLP